ncbi:MAG: hypothetical protein M1829_003923 [Trizodia sp. TS-e1964]|nr:MAG: hypothetical protein M1829_003923 [Trizodia sp. TS-e1964]
MLQPRLLLKKPRRTWTNVVPWISSKCYATLETAVKDGPPKPELLSNSYFAPPPVTGDSSGYAMKTYTPRTPGVRHLKRPINDHLWKGRPFLPLTFARKGQGIGGRNNTGRVTVRHRGGGHKRRIRMVDFTRMTPGKQVVERIEHDPGRSAHIALLNNEATGRKSYIVAAEGMRAGDVVQSYRAGVPEDLMQSMGGSIDPGVLAARTAWRGNCLPMHMIPVGTVVFNVGSAKERGGVFCRSAGTYATVISKDGGKTVTVRLQSGEVRKVSSEACATVGIASNSNHQHAQLGKAGRSRWLGIRPTVRGVAMNAADHPHGGGRGKSKGNVHPVSPWGMPAKSGYKTRIKSKENKWVVTPRVRNQGKRKRTLRS